MLLKHLGFAVSLHLHSYFASASLSRAIFSRYDDTFRFLRKIAAIASSSGTTMYTMARIELTTRHAGKHVRSMTWYAERKSVITGITHKLPAPKTSAMVMKVAADLKLSAD